MADKRPEIELEVSCGGTFRLATEAMALRVTVLDPGSRTPIVAPAPAAPAAAAAPAPAPSPPPSPAAEDPAARFAATILERWQARAGEAAAALAGEGGTGSGAILAGRRAVDTVRARLADRLAALPDEAGRIQAQLVNLRFALTFLKNHPLLARMAHGEADEVTVSRADLEKLAAKVGEALNLAATVNDLAGNMKKRLAGEGDQGLEEGIDALADGARALLDGAYQAAAAMESGSDDPAAAWENAGADLAAALTPDTPEAAADDDEMSDEEALAKLAEFGLT